MQLATRARVGATSLAAHAGRWRRLLEMRVTWRCYVPCGECLEAAPPRTTLPVRFRGAAMRTLEHADGAAPVLKCLRCMAPGCRACVPMQNRYRCRLAAATCTVARRRPPPRSPAAPWPRLRRCASLNAPRRGCVGGAAAAWPSGTRVPACGAGVVRAGAASPLRLLPAAAAGRRPVHASRVEAPLWALGLRAAARCARGA